MTVRVYKATEIKFAHLVWFFYGDSGSGKTTLIGTFPGPIAVINFTQEKGADTLRDHPLVTVYDVTEPKDVIDAVNMIVANHKDFKTVAVDGVSTWCEILYRDQAGRGKVEWSHWKNWKSLIFSVLERLRSLPLEVVITAQKAASDDDVTGTTKGGPAVFGSLKGELPSRVQAYVYLECEVDIRGYVKYRAYPSGKGVLGGRVRGTLPSGPIDAPTFKKLYDAFSKPLFSGAAPAAPPAPPPEEKKEGEDPTKTSA